MWVCTNVGFISIVQDAKDPNTLKVRARKREHLVELFPGEEILETERTDYRFRVIVDRFTVAQKVFDLIANAGHAPGSVDYGNFKDSVRDHSLHDLYADFWTLHYRYQHAQPKTFEPLKGGKARAVDAQRAARAQAQRGTRFK